MSKSNTLPLITENLAVAEAFEPRPVPPRTPLWKRRAAAWSRWLHIYLSMVSFAILFFFAVTGFTLNHQDWFAGQQRTVQKEGTVPAAWVGTARPESVDRLDIVEFLRRTHGIHAAMSDFRIDNGQVSVSFKGPGYAADAFIDRKTGAYELTESRMGFAAVVNDLHKGRDSGPIWGAVIDVSAVFMIVVSASGILLICFLQRRRFSGLMAASLGAALCWFVCRIWVP